MPKLYLENSTLLAALSHAARTHGAGRVALADATTSLTYRALWMKAAVLARVLPVREKENVGVLLPTAPGAAVVFFALHRLGAVPAMLNFTAGERGVVQACETAAVRTVLTSRAFIEKGDLQPIIAALEAHCRVVFLDDLRGRISLLDTLAGAWAALSLRAPHTAKPHDAAVILFTSGSEGAPKGVALSHTNLLSNVEQVCSMFDFSTRDVLFNPLPVFHSFGLMAGLLLPLMTGMCGVLHPSPLQYKLIPARVRKTRATILLATDTFLQMYARHADAEDFHTLRLAVAGAEKLKPATRALYAEKYGVAVMEGYGVTEASPVISCNVPTAERPGTVGRLLPGMEAQLEAVEGIARGGRMRVKGPNIMLGYMRHTAPGIIEPQGEWYDTGDIVEISADGFITICGRAKRFAKIGGEMVSLTVVEELAGSLWPDHTHAALAVSDARKGEHIVLMSDYPSATRDALIAAARAQGVPEIALPKRVEVVEALPRLGSGKINYPALQQLQSTLKSPHEPAITSS